MTRTMLDDLIQELQEARKIIGINVPVIVTGLYGSTADEIKVVTNMTDGNVFLETDICSG